MKKIKIQFVENSIIHNTPGLLARIIFISCITIVTSVLPISISFLFDNFSDGSKYNANLVLITALLISCQAILMYVQKCWSNTLTYTYVFREKNEVFNSVLASPLTNVNETDESNIFRIYGYDLGLIGDFFGNQCVNELPMIISGFLALLISLIKMPSVTLIGLLVFPSIIYLTKKIGEKIQKVVVELAGKSEKINDQIAETIDTIVEISSFSVEEQKEKEFIVLLTEKKRATLLMNFYNSLLNFIGSIGSIVPIFSVMILGMFFVKKGYYPLSDWVVIYYLLNYFSSLFTELPSFATKYSENSVSVKRLLNLKKKIAKQETSSDKTQMIINRNNKDFRKEMVVVENYYQKIDSMRLSDINFTIHFSDKIVLSGESGSGKTTLINALKRAIVNKSECIRLSKDITVSYSNDLVFLFPGTLKENLISGLPEKCDNPENIVKRAIATAQLDSFVSKLPGGLDTKIEGTDHSFSGGELQKISLARSLVKCYSNDNVLLLWDEATSFVDIESEEKIYKAVLHDKNITALIVSHRDTPIKYCDKILTMKQGKIIQQKNLHH